MSRFLIVASWKTVYADPIVLEKDQLAVLDHTRVETDPQWEGWVWVIAGEKSGWAPRQILEVVSAGPSQSTVRILQAYSAQELDGGEGETISGERVLNGWIWATHERTGKQGWFPLNQLRQLS